MSDTIVTLALVAGFAGLITTHVATLFGLVRRGRPGRAAGAFIAPPLAPIWAIAGGMHVRGALWIACAALYITAFVIAR